MNEDLIDEAIKRVRKAVRLGADLPWLPTWLSWAEGWLSRRDRTVESAEATATGVHPGMAALDPDQLWQQLGFRKPVPALPFPDLIVRAACAAAVAAREAADALPGEGNIAMVLSETAVEYARAAEKTLAGEQT